MEAGEWKKGSGETSVMFIVQECLWWHGHVQQGEEKESDQPWLVEMRHIHKPTGISSALPKLS